MRSRSRDAGRGSTRWIAGACAGVTILASAATQRPAVGSLAPLPAARDLQGIETSLKQFAGPRGLVLFFWAGWSERSIEELRSLDATRQELTEHGVGVVAINVERQMMAGEQVQAVRDVVTKLGLSIPILVDEGLKLFSAYGVIAVPSTALVNGKGEVVYFLSGYSHADRVALADAIDHLAGIERSRATVAVPRAAPAALRRLQLGRLQLAGGRDAAARASFEAAAAADPNFADPIVELAALALDEGDLPRARGLLDRALATDATHRAASSERARLRVVENDPDEAQRLLENLTSSAPDPLALGYLGFVLHAGRHFEAAAVAFDRAREAGGPDPRAFLKGDRTVAQAMAAYRRALVAGGR